MKKPIVMEQRIILIFVAALTVTLAILLVSRVTPQNTISRRDIVTTAVVDKFDPSRIPYTNITAAIWIALNKRATAGFEMYSRGEHSDKSIHLVAGASRLADIAMYQKFTNEHTGQIECNLYFTNYDEATRAYSGLLK
jgi:hypothetical protein